MGVVEQKVKLRIKTHSINKYNYKTTRKTHAEIHPLDKLTSQWQNSKGFLLEKNGNIYTPLTRYF